MKFALPTLSTTALGLTLAGCSSPDSHTHHHHHPQPTPAPIVQSPSGGFLRQKIGYEVLSPEDLHRPGTMNDKPVQWSEPRPMLKLATEGLPRTFSRLNNGGGIFTWRPIRDGNNHRLIITQYAPNPSKPKETFTQVEWYKDGRTPAEVNAQRLAALEKDGKKANKKYVVPQTLEWSAFAFRNPKGPGYVFKDPKTFQIVPLPSELAAAIINANAGQPHDAPLPKDASDYWDNLFHATAAQDASRLTKMRFNDPPVNYAAGAIPHHYVPGYGVDPNGHPVPRPAGVSISIPSVDLPTYGQPGSPEYLSSPVPPKRTAALPKQ